MKQDLPAPTPWINGRCYSERIMKQDLEPRINKDAKKNHFPTIAD